MTTRECMLVCIYIAIKLWDIYELLLTFEILLRVYKIHVVQPRNQMACVPCRCDTPDA